MKLSCPKCASVYSLADEKVRGRLVKVRCRRCGDLFLVRGEEEEEPTHPTVPPAGPRLTGERNEASQLFSLEHLSSIASPPASSSEPTEGSGLIDIRRMAAVALERAPQPDDRPSVPVPVPAVAMFAPVLLPHAAARAPWWVWGVVIAGVVTASGSVLAVLAHRPRAAPVATAPRVAPPPPLPQPVAASIAPPQPAPPTPSPPSVHAPARRSARTTVRAAVAPRETPPPAPPARDELSLLLEHASPETAPQRAVVAAPDEELPDHLPMTEVRRGLNAIQPKVDLCFAQAGTRAPATVSLAIGGDGRVHEAHTTGALARSAVGECLERAAKSASFKHFRGTAMSLSYAFLPHGS